MINTIMEMTEQQCDVLIGILKNLDPQIDLRVQYLINKNNITKPQALEVVVTQNPILWAKVYLNWQARDYQFPMIMETKNSQRLVFRLGRRLGKCLTGDSLILDPITGEYKRIDDLYKNKSANVVSFDTTSYKTISTNTNIVTDNGIKDVYKITTQSGREIKATGNHPFWTINGYKELDDLNVNDYISISSCNIPSNPLKMDENIIKLLAYMIGDGTTTKKSNIRFSCSINNKKVIDEMKNICSSYSCEMFKYDSDKKADYHIRMLSIPNKKRTNNIANILEKYNLTGKNANNKTIPNDIFRLDNKQLATFISRLYATDGWATSSFKEKGRIEIGYCSNSKTLLVQLQSLLLRFGINSKLSEKKVKYNNQIKISYTLGIYSCHDCKTFIDNIGIFSKENAINDLKETLNKMVDYGKYYPIEIKDILLNQLEKNNISKQKVREYSGLRFDSKYSTICESKLRKANEIIKSKKVQNILDSDIIWDKIVSIEYIGRKQTYDFTVPEYHNFVVNDFITHNTEVMCITILWHAYTQINKGPNDQYNILIATPYVNQIDLIFTRLHQLIENAVIISNNITRDIQHRLEIRVNGVTSIIQGFTAGANSGDSGSNSTRGQHADVIILDEVDYMGSKQIQNIMQMRNEAPERIKIIAASTPCGKHEEYYKWCTNASKSYSPSEDDIKNNTFTGYEIKRRQGKHGNGWTQVYAPSNVNPEVLKINPETKQTYLEDMKDEYTQMAFAQEVMAEFGEENIGVYQKKFIRAAVDEGYRVGYQYITKWKAEDKIEYLRKTQGHNIRCLGVDWDKFGAATHMVCIEYDRYYIYEDGTMWPKFKVLFHEEIPRGEFTYDNAMQKILSLNEEYKFDWIAIDKGYGEVQLELLHKYGMEHPETGLTQKVIAYQFGQNIEVIDPFTRKKSVTMMKPFMVNNSVNIFEKQKIVLDPTDKYLIDQLESYRVVSISQLGKPIYSSENEHALDAMNLALLIFAQHNDFLLRKIYSSRVAVVNRTLGNEDSEINPRGMFEEELVPDLPIVSINSKQNREKMMNEGIIGSGLFGSAAKRGRPMPIKREMW